MRNVEIDPYKLVELGLITLAEGEYITYVHNHQVHSTGSGMSFWVGIREKPDGLDKMTERKDERNLDAK